MAGIPLLITSRIDVLLSHQLAVTPLDLFIIYPVPCHSRPRNHLVRHCRSSLAHQSLPPPSTRGALQPFLWRYLTSATIPLVHLDWPHLSTPTFTPAVTQVLLSFLILGLVVRTQFLDPATKTLYSLTFSALVCSLFRPVSRSNHPS